ncbi:Sec2 [Kluyveromyces lactis]|nr:Sec2 [Kluyveromyces lactis]
MADQEESKRISLQVTSLSTQLIESIDKQSQLEEQLLVAKKTISTQQNIANSYNELKQELQSLKLQYETDKTKFKKQEEICADAEKKVATLNQEIEDLTASLFDEANNMVADARKEQNAVEILNSKLKEQLKEKDLLLDTLSMQLKNLKNVLYKFENDFNSSKNVSLSDSATSSTTSIDRSTTNQTSVNDNSLSLQGVLFSPLLHSLRYDVPLYTEYLKFLAVLPQCENLHQTTSESKLLRRLINYEISPVLRLDNASGVGWLVKRNLMNLMMEGLVSIEPISGINETYRTGYSSPSIPDSPEVENKESHLFSRPVNSPPVAMVEPCAFCGENRNDILEHGRLYIFKTYQKLESGKTELTNQFPVCHYCLLKLRQVCEIFAFLRSLRSGAWHLEKVALASIHQGKVNAYSEVTKASRPKMKSKRLSIFQGLKQSQSSTPIIENGPQFADKNGLPTTNIQRSWARLSQLRASLQWSHIGVWSLDESVATDIAPSTDISKAKSFEEEQGLGIASKNIPVPITPGEDETFDFEADTANSISVDETVNGIRHTDRSSDDVGDDNEKTNEQTAADLQEKNEEKISKEFKPQHSRQPSQSSTVLNDNKESAESVHDAHTSSEEPSDLLETYQDLSADLEPESEKPENLDNSDEEDSFNDAKDVVN